MTNTDSTAPITFAYDLKEISELQDIIEQKLTDIERRLEELNTIIDELNNRLNNGR